MKNLQYKISIAATPQKVWDIMIDKKSYRDWTNAAWPGSRYEGEWKQGTSIKFMGEDGTGTLATVTTFEPYTKILLTHIAMLQKGGIEDTESEFAKKWVNSLEGYSFADNNGTTGLSIDMKVPEEFAEMFDNDWPKALARLKEICEA